MSMELDRQKLIEYYHGLGFLDVRITPEVERTADMGHVRIVYHIDEGQQYHVAGQGHRPATSRSETDRLDSLTELKAGERYDRGRFAATLQRIKDYYGVRGYPVGVEQQLYEVPGSRAIVQVQYEVHNDRGAPDRVGRVTSIEGERRHPRPRDPEPARACVLPGQILPYTEARGRPRCAWPGSASSTRGPAADRGPAERVRQRLQGRYACGCKETRTGQFMVGGSVNTDMRADRQRHASTSGTSNPDAVADELGRHSATAGRSAAAGRSCRIEAAPGTQFQRYSATWREPYLLDTPFGLTDSGYYFNRSFAEYNEDRYGGRFTLDRRLDPIWRASLSTRVEGVNITDVPFFAPPSITDDAGSTSCSACAPA